MAETQVNTPEASTLTRLVSELSLEERHDFLKKLQGQSTMTFEPLYETDAEEAAKKESLKEQYARLPWFQRLYYFIQGLFRGKPPVTVFEDTQIGKLGRAIDAQAPGLYDYQRNLLLTGFHQYLTSLKEAARFFFTALDTSVNRDKADFYAFLGSLEMEEAHRILQVRTTPEAILGNAPDISDAELRQMALRIMEDAFSSIDEHQRTVMYFNARSLRCLKELSAFLFDRVLMAFSNKSGTQTCPANAVREMLVTLNNILSSLKDPPNLSLLESLFVFQLQERSGGQNFDMDNEMRLLLSKAENAIALIRNFNRHIPLTRILRCISRDMRLTPQHISGGEDWFQVYREYWRRRVEGRITDYLRQNKYREISNSCRLLLKDMDMRILENVTSDTNHDGFPLNGVFALSFLRSFHYAVFFPEINPLLRPIIIEGHFAKKENRSHFTSAYNDIMNIEDEIRKLDLSLAPTGDYGKRYTQAMQDMSSLPVKRRKIQIIIDDASDEAEGIVARVTEAICEIVNMLNTVLKKGTSGRHEGLANFDKFAGRNPEGFISGITGMITQFQKTLQILNDIESLEKL